MTGIEKRAVFTGVVVALLLLLFAATTVWLATTAGSGFFGAGGIIGLLIILAATGGFFLAPGTSVSGFVTRWRTEWRQAFPMPVDDDEVMRDTRWTRDTFLLIANTGLVAIFIYALQWQPAGFARIFGSGLMIAVAAMVVGVCLGFLFGIPRTLQGVHPPPAAGAAADPASPATLGVNTNLEQISDWLTKIIVGLGLINLDKLPRKIDNLLVRLAPSLAHDKGFVLAIVTGYGVCGFMLGYLLTRLYLMRAFTLADQVRARAAEASKKIEQVIDQTGADKAVDPTVGKMGPDQAPVSDKERAAAKSVQYFAEAANSDVLRQRIDALAREYETVRASMPPSDERTQRMEVIASKMSALSLACYDLLPALAASPSPGHRLAAVSFLEVKPDENYVAWLGDRPRVERRFIAYHAAWALRWAAAKLPAHDLEQVKKAIDVAMKQGKEEDSARARILEEALKEVTARMA